MIGKTFLALLPIIALASPALPESTGKESTISIAEMDADYVMFEVSLPQSEAHRRNVVHQVIDNSGSVLTTEKFGTASGHYKISMIGLFIRGQQYEFVVDGKYRLQFVYRPGDKNSPS